MFCPKCGKDCADFKFCPQCGTQLPDVEEKTVGWAVGMACPHCGGTKLEGNCCAFCGAVLKEDAQAGEFAEIPLGTYDGNSVGMVILERNTFVVRRSIAFRKYEQRIGYNQIVLVQYIRATKYHLGHLIVRWEGNKKIPIPVSGNECLCDKTTVPFREEYNDEFYRVFRFLQNRAPKSAQFSMRSLL